MDFRFETSSALDDLGGPQARFDANIHAIALSLEIEHAERAATPDEQHALARYVGWGDSRVLNLGFDKHTRKACDALAKLLPEADLKRLRASALNAHYTALPIIDAIWSGVVRLFGTATGRLEEQNATTRMRILEPSCGVGHFLSRTPPVFSAARTVAVEIEPVAARITRLLHPSAQVLNRALEETRMADGTFDLVISNIPFGNYRVHDPALPDRAMKGSIHTYFFAKALTLARPGGIVAFITSRYTLDTQDVAAREWMAERADLLAAVRLPDTAFRANAGTEVVTDVIFLRKHMATTAPRRVEQRDARPAWLDTDVISVHEQSFTVNRLYAGHHEGARSERVIGVQSAAGSMYGAKSYTVEADSGLDVAERLRAELTRQLPDYSLDDPRNAGHEAIPPDPAAHATRRTLSNPGLPELEPPLIAPETRPEDEFAVGFAGKPKSKFEERARDALRMIYASAKTLINAQLHGLCVEDVARARAALNEAYDSFRAMYGYIHDAHTLRALDGHPALPFLLALERKANAADASRGRFVKANLFSEDTVRPMSEAHKPEGPHDSLAQSLNKFGSVRLNWMAAQLAQSEDEIAAALKGDLFLDPASRQWLTSDTYLSGNLSLRLAAARAAAEDEPRFAENVAALEAALPRRLGPSEITARLGAGWIPHDVIEDYVRSLLPEIEVKAVYASVVANWSLVVSNRWVLNSVPATETYGTKRADAKALIEDALNARQTVIYDENSDGAREVNQAETVAAQAKQSELKARFERWVWEDPARAEQLATLYNERFNSYKERSFDGQHLTFPGLALDFTPRTHQRDAVWRVVQSRATYLAHTVGAGKTACTLMAVAELKRLRLCHKAMVVAPNHLVGQWAQEAAHLYPHMRVLAAGKTDFEPATRGEFLSKIATGNWDVVIVAHSQFKLLPVHPDTQTAFYQRELDTIEDALREMKHEGDNPTTKSIEKAKKNLEVKLKDLADMKKDSRWTVTFEEMGIDFLTVDEFDLFKGVFFATKMGRIAGVSVSSSQRAFDMYIKIRWLLEQNTHGQTHTGRGRVLALSGTPISNSVSELYLIMKVFQPEMLEELELTHFDAWAQMFGEAVSAIEMTPDGGGWRMATRFAKFVNLPELMTLVRQVMDVKLQEHLKLPVPRLHSGEPVTAILPMSKSLRRYVSGLVRRADAIRSGSVEPSRDNMLKVTGDGRKATLDLRLALPGGDAALREEPLCKINCLVGIVHEVWAASAPRRGAQLIFCDMGTPKGKSNGDRTGNGNGNSGTKTRTPNAVHHGVNGASGAPTSHGVNGHSWHGTNGSSGQGSPSDIRGRAEQGNDDGMDEADDAAESETAEERSLANRVYDEIKRKLVARGIPAREIAFVHDAKTQDERLRLFHATNKGDVRVLIGSTEKLGAGTNAQERAIALHNLDIGWRPRDLLQRQGRIERQGNSYDEIFIFNYQIEGSFDAFMWQTVARKISFIQQAMSGDTSVRTVEDVGDLTLTYAELAATASGNPRALRRVWLESELVKLSRLRWVWEDQRTDMRRELVRLPDQIERAKVELALHRSAIQLRDSHEGEFAIELIAYIGSDEHRMYDRREEAGRHLMQLAMTLKGKAMAQKSGILTHPVGRYRGLELMLRAFDDAAGRGEILMTKPGVKAGYAGTIGDSPIGVIQSLDAQLRGIDKRLEESSAYTKHLENRSRDIKASLEKPWEHVERATELKTELDALLEDLKSDKDQNRTAEDPARSVEQDDNGETYLPASENVAKSMERVRIAIERIRAMHATAEATSATEEAIDSPQLAEVRTDKPAMAASTHSNPAEPLEPKETRSRNLPDAPHTPPLFLMAAPVTATKGHMKHRANANQLALFEMA